MSFSDPFGSTAIPSRKRGASPTPSARSTRSFLDSDPYSSSHPASSYHNVAPVAPLAQSTAINANAVSATNLLPHLENLLVQKANAIHLAGQLGQSLLAQQLELEQRIKSLAEVQAEFVKSPEGIRARRQREQSGGGNEEAASGSEGEADKELGTETRKRLEELEEEMKRWDEGNNQVYAAVAPALAAPLDPTASEDESYPATTTAFDSPPRQLSSMPPPESAPGARRPSISGVANSTLSRSVAVGPGGAPATPSAAASRRARNNAQHRTNDIELATEIGQSLLVEVRRLQGLLAEKDETLREGERDKAALEHELEAVRASMKTCEESVDKYKEENWNLEVATQELRASLVETQSLVAKTEVDRSRLTKEVSTLKDSVEFSRSEAEKLKSQLESLKTKHETDMATMRKNTAGLQRDKSDLQTQLGGLKSELEKKNFKRSVSGFSTLEGTEEREFDGNTNELDPQFGDDDDPSRVGGNRRKTGDGFPSLHDENSFDASDAGSEFGDVHDSPVQRGVPESASLRMALAHAQKSIQGLKAQLASEKASKSAYPTTPGSDDWSEESSIEGTPPPRSIRGSARRGGRGSARGSARGRGGARNVVGMPSRLGRVVSHTGDDEEEEDEMEEIGDDSVDLGHHVGAVDNASIFEHQFPPQADEDALSDAGTDNFDSPTQNRIVKNGFGHAKHGSVVSIEMDPQFASSGASDAGESPNRRPLSSSEFGDSSPTGRPTSGLFTGMGIGAIVGGALGKELSEKKEIVWVDQSTMTDFPAPPPPEPVIIHAPAPEPIIIHAPPPPPKEVSHVGVQATPEPVVVPIISKADFGGQTEAEVIVLIEKKEMGTSTEPAPRKIDFGVATEPKAAGVEMEVQTDTIPEPEPRTVYLPTPVPVLPTLSSQTSTLSKAMEDRALQSQPSLSDLARDPLATPLASSTAIFEKDPTVTRGMSSLRSPPPDSDEETDRGLETETDGEFEDARESIGVASPSFGGPTPPASLSDFHSINDFHSIRSDRTGRTARTLATEEDSGSDVEVLDLKKVPARYRSNGRLEASPSPRKPVVALAEVGVQTDEWKPPAAPALVPMPLGVNNLQKQAPSKRDSVNTFGMPDELDVLPALATSAAVAGTYLGYEGFSQSRALSPDENFRPDSAMSNATQITDSASPSPSSPAALDKSTATVRPTSPGLMGPPARIPARPKPPTVSSPRKSGGSSSATSILRSDQPPPRPTSPPPADLLYRAQSPAFDYDFDRKSNLQVPGSAIRSTPSTVNSRNQNLRPQPSVSDYASSNVLKGKAPVRRQQSSAVSVSEMSMHSDVSRRMSLASSRTSEGGFDTPMRTGGDSTDPAVIHAITQTMIGEYLHKYTRRAIGKGISEKRHKRYFWVHPYTKTLYWSASDPGAHGTTQSSSKSVFISGVRQVLDPNPSPPGLHQGSIIVKTPNREMKFTAPTRERHDMWFNAINYLLARPDAPTSLQGTPSSPVSSRSRKQSDVMNWDTPATGRASQLYLHTTASDSRLTPRGGKSSSSRLSTFKKHGTAAEEFERHTMFGSPRSLRTFSDFIGADESVEFVNKNDIPLDYDHAHEDDDGYEGLENVRACCDGKHDVGSLSRKGHHHHHSRASDVELAGTPSSPSRRRSKSSGDTTSFGGTFSRRKVVPPPVKSAPQNPTNAPFAPLTTNTGSLLNRQPLSARSR